MTEPEQLPYLKKIYPTLPAMLRKFDRFARKRAFMGKSVGEFERWRTETRTLLHELLGTEKMESSPAQPQLLSTTAVEGGITREHWRIQVEPEVWMTLFLLVPESADNHVGLPLPARPQRSRKVFGGRCAGLPTHR